MDQAFEDLHDRLAASADEMGRRAGRLNDAGDRKAAARLLFAQSMVAALAEDALHPTFVRMGSDGARREGRIESLRQMVELVPETLIDTIRDVVGHEGDRADDDKVMVFVADVRNHVSQALDEALAEMDGPTAPRL